MPDTSHGTPLLHCPSPIPSASLTPSTSGCRHSSTFSPTTQVHHGAFLRYAALGETALVLRGVMSSLFSSCAGYVILAMPIYATERCKYEERGGGGERRIGGREDGRGERRSGAGAGTGDGRSALLYSLIAVLLYNVPLIASLAF